MPNNLAQLPEKVEEKKSKQLWEKGFDSIPEVLTLEDIATFLRVDESSVKILVKDGQLKTLPALAEDRVFKAFLLSYLTQNHPEAMGLIQKNMDKEHTHTGIRGSASVGF